MGSQACQSRITLEERPAGKTGIHAPFEPRQGFSGFAQKRMDARDLVVGVVGMSKRSRRSASPPYAV